jgi:hypothetical protein
MNVISVAVDGQPYEYTGGYYGCPVDVLNNVKRKFPKATSISVTVWRRKRRRYR